MLVIMETILFLVLLLVAWKAWKKTMKECAKDDFTSLMKEWLTFHEEMGYALDSHTYRNMHTMLNNYLAHVSEFRLIGMLSFVFLVDQETMKELRGKQEKLFRTNDREIALKMNAIRHRAVRTVQVYMLSTSVVFIPIVLLATLATGVMLFKRPLLALKRGAARVVDGMRITTSATIEINAYSTGRAAMA